MKLDRNINADGRGKYALVKLRRVTEVEKQFGKADGSAGAAVWNALGVLQSYGIIDWGDQEAPEFMLIRLKDAYAAGALKAYALAAIDDEQVEYGNEVMEMAKRSGANHPNCKKPD